MKNVQWIAAFAIALMTTASVSVYAGRGGGSMGGTGG